MKNRYGLLFTGLALLSLTSCLKDYLFEKGNGIIVTELRRTGDFQKIDNSTFCNVVYRKADSTSVSVCADENLQHHLVTEICNKRLEIRTRPLGMILDYSQRPLITVTSPRIDEANLSGSGSLSVDKMSGSTINLRLSGSGDIEVNNINCTTLSAMISGSGKIAVTAAECSASDLSTSGSGTILIAGTCETEQAKISGSGEIDGRNFVTVSATVSISGSGDVYGNVSEYLKATISGSGNIYLYGNPRIDQKRSGSGRIKWL